MFKLKAPFQIVFCLYFLYGYIGFLPLISFSGVIATWLTGYLFAKMLFVYRIRRDKLRASRLKQIDDLFRAIKVILNLNNILSSVLKS